MIKGPAHFCYEERKREGKLVYRLKKFADAQPEVVLPEVASNIDLETLNVEADSADFNIETDPSYPGQWR